MDEKAESMLTDVRTQTFSLLAGVDLTVVGCWVDCLLYQFIWTSNLAIFELVFAN